MENIKDKSNIGIIDIEIYFPKYYISQQDLEEYTKVPKGKYTKGLGQTNMSFTSDNEDINSICLTVLTKLIIKNKIPLTSIGRIEVGSETFIDKSKSIKTHLMDIFNYDNINSTDIEGVTVSNACYGGVSSLINTFNWMTSKYYDGRYAIVISGDIAVYSKGKARPTGGAGAVGVLLGIGGCISLDYFKASSMKNIYDFYKPNPISEYPIVDGAFSMKCYLEALWNCLMNYFNKNELNENQFNINNIYYAFHCPYSKLVEKAYFLLKSVLIIKKVENNKNEKLIKIVNKYNAKYWEMSKEEQNYLKECFINEFNNKVLPGLFLCKQLGNLYTASIFGFLLSLIMNFKDKLINKKILCFSYGSGYASTIFSLNIDNDNILKIFDNNNDINERLNQRIKKTPMEYEHILLKKEKLFLSNNYIPSSNINDLFPFTFYLEKIDDKWRRYYNINQSNFNNNTIKEICQNYNQNLLNQKKQYLGINNNSKVKETKNLLNNSNNNLITFQKKLPTLLIWQNFYKKSILERQFQIKKLFPHIDLSSLKEGGLNLLRADNMVENCIGVLSIPIGLGLNFKINGKDYAVPMATEEPSVIAAASSAAKLISNNDGFFCYNDTPFMMTQILYQNGNNNQSFIYNKQQIEKNKHKIITYGNKSICNRLVLRGGGIFDMNLREINNEYFSLDILVNVCEAMGANILNQISEEISKYLISTKIIENKSIMKILSNLCVYRKSTAEFRINIKNLEYKGYTGKEIAENIIKANSIAKNDPFRAATHNKGIMNGIIAAALALGQDTRAIESAIHSYASLDPVTLNTTSYHSLTIYEIITINKEQYLYGNLTIPLPIGTVGGAINSNNTYKNMFHILYNPSVTVLGHILASVGLAQNFAALRALVSEGIQKGHIGLHAKNIAYRVGVPDYLIPDVVEFMKQNNSINEITALKYLESFKIFEEIRKKNNDISSKKYNNKVCKNKQKLSSFFIEVNFDFLKHPLCMNFLIKSKISPEINFHLMTRKINNGDKRIAILFKELFGKDKQVEWLYEFMILVHEFDFFKEELNQQIYQIKYKIKLMIILIFVISSNILRLNFDVSNIFLKQLINSDNDFNKKNEIYLSINNLDPKMKDYISLELGMTLVLELYQILHFHLNNYCVLNTNIRKLIKEEIKKSIDSFISIYSYKNINKDFDIKNFDIFFELRLKRLNAGLLLLVDLGMNNKIYYDNNQINNYLSLGRYASINITVLRDFFKWKKTKDIFFTNSYQAFYNMMNRYGINNNSIIEKKYFDLKKDELISLKNIIKNCVYNGIKGDDIINKVENKFRSFYQSQILSSKF